MLILGLTGSIATGKSTVASLLSQSPYSLPIIDSDLLARKVVEPGTSGYNKIVSHFGPTTPDLLVSASEAGGEDGPAGKGRPLNRPVLGRRVFGDNEERKRDRLVLNGIVHPAVRWETYKLITYYYLKGHWAVVLDVPLLFEAGSDQLCGTVIVVAVTDPVIQMKRLRERDSHLSAEDAENRVKSQGDVKEKAKRAQLRGPGRGLVIWNDEGKDELKSQLQTVMADVRQSSPDWWGWLLLLCPPVGAVAGLYEVVRSRSRADEWSEMKKREKARL